MLLTKGGVYFETPSPLQVSATPPLPLVCLRKASMCGRWRPNNWVYGTMVCMCVTCASYEFSLSSYQRSLSYTVGTLSKPRWRRQQEWGSSTKVTWRSTKVLSSYISLPSSAKQQRKIITLAKPRGGIRDGKLFKIFWTEGCHRMLCWWWGRAAF